MVRVRIEYTCDRITKNGDNQRGRIIVTTPTGVIKAKWSCTGGRGDGSEVVSNTTTEFDDDLADELVNNPEICQGIGVYDADVVEGDYGWLDVENVTWVDPPAEPTAA